MRIAEKRPDVATCELINRSQVTVTVLGYEVTSYSCTQTDLKESLSLGPCRTIRSNILMAPR